MASIVQRGKAENTYAVTYYSTTMEGKKKKEWISGLTKGEARIKKREIEIAIEKNNLVMPINMTVEAFLNDFVQKVAKKRWKQTTYTTNTALLRNHVIPYIGRIKLSELRAYQITAMFAILEKKPTNMINKYRPRGHVLSSTMLRHIFVLLQEALTRAVKWELLDKSPMPPDDDRPTRAKVENRIWPKELFQQAIQEMDHHQQGDQARDAGIH